MTNTALDAIFETADVTVEGYGAHVPPDWMQGRTCYGGLSAAIALDATQRLLSPQFPLRSALVSFVGPVAGDCWVDTSMIREGKSSQATTALVSSENGAGTLAMFTFGKDRESHVNRHILPMPDVLPPEQVEARRPSGGLPSFTQHFDMRLAGGEKMMSGAEHGELIWWVRFNEQPQCDPAVALLALGDALPPPALTQMSVMGPMSSMNWTMHFIDLAPQTDDGWWLIRSTTTSNGHGFSTQIMTIWNRAGQPVATGGQGVALYA